MLVKLMLEPARHGGARFQQGHVGSCCFLNRIAQKGEVRAAQHQHVGARRAQGGHRPTHGRVDFRPGQRALLHQPHPFRAGVQHDSDLGRFALDQGGELGAGQGAGGGEHAHHAAVRQVRGGFDCRFHADDDQVGMALAQRRDGGGGRRVAGDHHGLGLARDEVIRQGVGTLQNEGLRLFAIRHMRRIGHIQQLFLGQRLADGAQHAQAAHARVVYANKGIARHDGNAPRPGPRRDGGALRRSVCAWRPTAAHRARSGSSRRATPRGRSRSRTPRLRC
ncbi:hypothetical protein D3C72_798450 [compost metagenome]